MILSRDNIFPLMDAVAQRLIKSVYNGSILEYQHVAELFAIASSIITWSGTAQYPQCINLIIILFSTFTS